jgi:hypothetical protein
VVGVKGAAIHVGAEGYALAELFSRSDLVARPAKAADVVVGVGAALRQGHDMVGHRRGRVPALLSTVSA